MQDEVAKLRVLIAILTNQRNFAFSQLAEMEATLIFEREAAARAQATAPAE